MITLSAPLYDFNGRRLVAVVGVDILLTQIVNRIRLSADTAREDIVKDSRQSRPCLRDKTFDECDAPALRFNRPSSNVCVSPRAVDAEGRSSANATCFGYRTRYYAVSRDDVVEKDDTVPAPTTFDDARQLCNKSDRSPAGVPNAEDNRALAELVAVDGSWLGVRGTGGVWKWVNASTALLHPDRVLRPSLAQTNEV